MHLGDVYYSGTRREVRRHFLDLWPRVPNAINRACNSNHEMYSGGEGYFGETLLDFQQPSSTFLLENSHWVLAGLDTAYYDHDLDDDQVHGRPAVSRLEGRRLVLFSHHQPFSLLASQGPQLQRKLANLLAAGTVHAWYWGHEHLLAIYERHPAWGMHGRCVGHSGFPYFRPHFGEAPRIALPEGMEFRIMPTSGFVPGASILTDPTSTSVTVQTSTARTGTCDSSSGDRRSMRSSRLTASCCGNAICHDRGRDQADAGTSRPGAVRKRPRCVVQPVESGDRPISQGDGSAGARRPRGRSKPVAPTPEQLQALEQAIRLLRPAPLVMSGSLEPLKQAAKTVFPAWEAFRSSVQPYLGAIGRIDRPPVSGYDARPVGTGFLISDRCLVTNRHVLDLITLGTDVLAPGQAVVRFGREYATVPDPDPVPITSIVAAHPDLDLAILALSEPTAGVAPIVVDPGFVSSEGTAIAAIGYPMDDNRNPAWVLRFSATGTASNGRRPARLLGAGTVGSTMTARPSAVTPGRLC